eukprot:9526426-Prorocentrum_lima.AAC.1
MTSSLVGSEMCIRDRTLQASSSIWWILGSRGAWLRQSQWWLLSGGWASAVSYTHLTLPTICSV